MTEVITEKRKQEEPQVELRGAVLLPGAAADVVLLPGAFLPVDPAEDLPLE